jgi:hypothetical protein
MRQCCRQVIEKQFGSVPPHNKAGSGIISIWQRNDHRSFIPSQIWLDRGGEIMTAITTTEQMRADAHELMERALCALDRAGESMAAIHLDFAIETLGQRSAGGRAAMLGGTAFNQHDTMKRARRIEVHRRIGSQTP